MLVVGCIVGIGIFRSASSIANHVQQPALILLLWVAGGLLSVCGALCYAELAAMFPATGGDYVYMSRIYGRFWGFLFGWTKLFVERTGTIAILVFFFAEYLSRVIPYGGGIAQRWLAAATVVGLTAVNIAGIRWGARVQNLFTVLKVGTLGGIICAGVWLAMRQSGAALDWTMPPIDLATAQSLGIGLVFVLFAYGGWTEAAYVAEEVRQPTRTIPRAILGGLLLTGVLYVLVSGCYLLAVPVAELPRTPLVAARVMQAAIGPAGGALIAAMIACSAFGASNGYILTGARILYALGKDHALFARLGRLHPVHRTPVLALWTNAAVATLLVFTKTFDQIATYSTVAISLFFMMTVFGVMWLRRRLPEYPRPYRAWGYPVTPIIFCLTMLGFIINIWMTEPREALFGFGFVALGIPLYWISQHVRQPSVHSHQHTVS
ncbi:MAG: amino acid permease [Candidatus Omnitrophica bacterium]|nr:amino acid permease [Candidatus Omnitrophota bacterium]